MQHLAESPIGIDKWFVMIGMCVTVGTVVYDRISSRARRDSQNDFTATSAAKLEMTMCEVKSDMKELGNKVEDRFGRVWKKMSQQETKQEVQANDIDNMKDRICELEKQ